MKTSVRRWLFVVALALGGCSVMETYPSEATKVEGCQALGELETGGPKAARLYHYRSDTEMGKPPPQTVSTKGSSASRTYITRRSITHGIDNPFNGQSAMIIGQVLALVVAGFLAIVGIGMVGARENPKRGATLLGVSVALVAGAFVFGHLAGSVLSIDNPSSQDLEVTVNGTVIKVPKESFVNVRVSGSTLEVDAKANGQLLEHVTLHIDRDLGDTVRRALFGNGRFAYPVCGSNEYFLETAKYTRR